MLARRLGAALFALLFVVSITDAMMLCAGMAMATGDPHTCCVGTESKPPMPDEAMSCCAVAQGFEAQRPVDATVALLDGLPVYVHVVAPLGIPAFHRGTRDGYRGPPVPLYLQHQSFLI